MASVPTEVERPSDVAGNGPPWTIAGDTSDTRAEIVGEDPPGLVLGDRQQAPERGEVAVGEVEGDRPAGLRAQPARARERRFVGAAHQQR